VPSFLPAAIMEAQISCTSTWAASGEAKHISIVGSTGTTA